MGNDKDVCLRTTNTIKPSPAREWFVDYLPITRQGVKVKEYVDGSDYTKDLYDDLNSAGSKVFMTGLHFMPDFKLVRPGGDDKQLVNVLKSLGQRNVEVYLIVNLFWPGEKWQAQGLGSLISNGPLETIIMSLGGLYGYFEQTLKLFQALQGLPTVYCRLDVHPGHYMHSNHQKTVVIDEKIAYVGGVDLTFIDGDRWDSPAHTIDNRAWDRTEKFWHDVHSRLEGDVVKFVIDNFHARWNEGNLYIMTWYNNAIDFLLAQQADMPGDQRYKSWQISVDPDVNRKKFERLKLPQPFYPLPYREIPKDPHAQVVRSMPEGPYLKQKPAWNLASNGRKFQSRTLEDDFERSAKDTYLLGIRAAQNYIYLENQWVSDEDIWSELVLAVKRNIDNPDFRVVVMLPAKFLAAAGFAANQDISISGHVADVIDACRDFQTFGMYSLMQNFPPENRENQIYVHSKILIIDDCWYIIGSANAGGISLEGVRDKGFGPGNRPDTELTVVVLHEQRAKQLREKIWTEHLGRALCGNPSTDADLFRSAADHGNQRVRYAGVYNEQFQKGKFMSQTHQGAFGVLTGTNFLHMTFGAKNKVDPALLAQCQKSGKIIPLDLNKGGDMLQRTYAFACQLPALPPFYEVSYRWICRQFPDDVFNPKNWWMLGVQSAGKVFFYRDQSTPQSMAYIGQKSLQGIIQAGGGKPLAVRIECRIQLYPFNSTYDDGDTSNTVVFKCDYVL